MNADNSQTVMVLLAIAATAKRLAFDIENNRLRDGERDDIIALMAKHLHEIPAERAS